MLGIDYVVFNGPHIQQEFFVCITILFWAFTNQACWCSQSVEVIRMCIHVQMETIHSNLTLNTLSASFEFPQRRCRSQLVSALLATYYTWCVRQQFLSLFTLSSLFLSWLIQNRFNRHQSTLLLLAYMIQ